MDFVLEGTPDSKQERRKRAYWDRVKTGIILGWLSTCIIVGFNDLVSSFHLLTLGLMVIYVCIIFGASGYQSDGE